MKKTVVSLLLMAAGSLLYGEILDSLAGDIEVGKPSRLGSLVLFPLRYNMLWVDDDIITMDEAFERGVLTVEEQEDGTVPWVKITNTGEKNIFIMGGEIITGCKQDRLIRSDVLIKPYRKNLKVPIYCVESGRWTEETDVFYSKKTLLR